MQRVCEMGVFVDHHFGRVDPVQLGVQRVRCALSDVKLAVGEVDPGDAGSLAAGRSRRRQKHTGQAAVCLGRQQRIIGQRAWRHDAHDLALDRSLAGCRVADLLANGDGLARSHESGQILFYSVHRDARHRNGSTVGGAALGECQSKQPGTPLSILVEHFIEIPHPVEQQQRTRLRFEAKVLLHHGGVRRKIWFTHKKSNALCFFAY